MRTYIKKVFSSIAVAIPILVGVIGVFLAYQDYHRKSAEAKEADTIVSEVIGLKSQVYGLNDTVKSIVTVVTSRQLEDKEKVETLNAIQMLYREQAKTLFKTISRLESNGRLLLLFNPDEVIYLRLMSIRTILTYHLVVDKPVRLHDDGKWENVAVNNELINNYGRLLEYLSRLERDQLRKQVRRRLRDLRELDSTREIKQLRDLGRRLPGTSPD